jgi:hypothetical protein
MEGKPSGRKAAASIKVECMHRAGKACRPGA